MEAVTVTQWTGLACAAHCFPNPFSAYCRAQILLLHSLFCLSPVLGSFPDEQIDLQVWNSPYSSLWFFLMASYLLFSPGNSPTTQNFKKLNTQKVILQVKSAPIAFGEMDTPEWERFPDVWCLSQGCLSGDKGSPISVPADGVSPHLPKTLHAQISGVRQTTCAVLAATAEEMAQQSVLNAFSSWGIHEGHGTSCLLWPLSTQHPPQGPCWDTGGWCHLQDLLPPAWQDFTHQHSKLLASHWTNTHLLESCSPSLPKTEQP